MNFNFQFPGFEQIENKTKPLMESVIYDVIIIGGGPSALTAAVYCLRKGLKTGLITKDFGGQIIETSVVENYMGYKYIEGVTLAQKFKQQVEQFDLSITFNVKVEKVINDEIKKIFCSDGKRYLAKSIIISTGKRWKTLNVPGEKELTGKGVAYCAICDAPLFKDKTVIVVGGGNSAVEAAIDLGKVARKVTLVQNIDKLTADKVLIDKLNKLNNLEILYSHTISKINGNNLVESVEIHDLKNDRFFEIKADGVFIEIGLIPNSEPFEGIVAMNQYKEIIVDCGCKTSAEGIFAAGDVTSVPFKQIIIAAGEGAKAALSACEYVLNKKEE
ncbi:MAG: FAD-dependent oxidoreductase [Spirochaetota bacterium]